MQVVKYLVNTSSSMNQGSREYGTPRPDSKHNPQLSPVHPSNFDKKPLTSAQSTTKDRGLGSRV